MQNIKVYRALQMEEVIGRDRDCRESERYKTQFQRTLEIVSRELAADTGDDDENEDKKRLGKCPEPVALRTDKTEDFVLEDEAEIVREVVKDHHEDREPAKQVQLKCTIFLKFRGLLRSFHAPPHSFVAIAAPIAVANSDI